MSIYILGISAFYHDSAACLIKDGEIISAAQEERFTRIKHDHNFPKNAVKFCLRYANINVNDLSAVAFYDKPITKFSRILETYLSYPGKGIKSFLMSMPLWLREKLWMQDLISTELNYDGKILFPEHHESHAASAFYPSPFQRSAFLTIDGVGEWATSSFGVGNENKIHILSELHYPHSLGLLYSAFTYFTGFKVNSGEYKVMGLAPYGEPKYVDKIYNHLIDLKEDGSFKMNMEYFNYNTGLTMTNNKFAELFDGPPRKPETNLTQREMDLARSLQDVTEEIMIRMARHVKKVTNEKYLCLAGGVALNCVGNGKLLRENIFDDIWIQPAAGDAGGALGAALASYYMYFNKPLIKKDGRDLQKGSYLGIKYSDDEIQNILTKHKIPFHKVTQDELIEKISDEIANGKIIGWFNGKMEFGPRALGSRSIIGDARNPEMQKKMNLKIKFRESFRPFAPSVLAEKVSEWFELDRESPYMLLVADVKKEKQFPMTEEQKNLWGIEKLNVVRSEIPAVTHVDYSARIQTVNKKDNPIYHRLIERFFEKTGCPVIVNTSFNVRGEPIVESPLDAYKCFMRTEIDILTLENFILYKEEQPKFLDDLDWKKKYELD
ncbi:carbamoyltransferase [Melioribacteraceae bacterium 09-Me]|uniref:Carbamoyltransferase n=1 Tax=Stygiobacter electus TaxID=3032292 RepID=A0AAE3NWX0_9BACT|nr:carbamoyltransferase [Stygiobacter electus]MDF1612461.1 carbamoyltransferase [Stygiobacter electus]